MHLQETQECQPISAQPCRHPQEDLVDDQRGVPAASPGALRPVGRLHVALQLRGPRVDPRGAGWNGTGRRLGDETG